MFVIENPNHISNKYILCKYVLSMQLSVLCFSAFHWRFNLKATEILTCLMPLSKASFDMVGDQTPASDTPGRYPYYMYYRYYY